MKTVNNNEAEKQKEEAAFRQKADNYSKCYIDKCPQRECCLHWLVGQYSSGDLPYVQSVNPYYPHVGTEQCEMFRKNERFMMKKGFTHLYHEMPTYMEQKIRQQLISRWGRKLYFQMRKGERLITPSQQQDVVEVCRENGWKGPIVYDGEQEDWLW